VAFDAANRENARAPLRVFLRHILQLHKSSALLKAGSVSVSKEKASGMTIPMQIRVDSPFWFQWKFDFVEAEPLHLPVKLMFSCMLQVELPKNLRGLLQANADNGTRTGLGTFLPFVPAQEVLQADFVLLGNFGKGFTATDDVVAEVFLLPGLGSAWH
jgi:hypothetical protein